MVLKNNFTDGSPMAADHAAAHNALANVIVDDVPAWTSYTPTWSSTGTAPTLGSSVLTGRYKRIGKTIYYAIRLDCSGTETVGVAGAYTFTLPSTSANAVVSYIGSAVYVDAAASSNVVPTVAEVLPSVNTVKIRKTLSALYFGPFAGVSANNDIKISGFYEEA